MRLIELTKLFRNIPLKLLLKFLDLVKLEHLKSNTASTSIRQVYCSALQQFSSRSGIPELSVYMPAGMEER